MSIDGVDDLHAAEDYGETLRLRAERAVELFEAGVAAGDVSDELADRFVLAMGMLRVSVNNRFVRPSCEAGECSETCGGYHPEGREAEEADDGDRTGTS